MEKIWGIFGSFEGVERGKVAERKVSARDAEAISARDSALELRASFTRMRPYFVINLSVDLVPK